MSEPHYTVYSGRLLNLCIERAVLIGLTERGKAGEKWPRLSELARSRYVRERLSKGCV